MTFDRERTNFATLLKRASAKKCDLFVWTTTSSQLAAAKRVVGNRAQDFANVAAKQTERRDKEQQYYLYKSPLRFLPMTTAQQTRINAAIRMGGGFKANGGKSWRRFLSPRQLGWLQQIEAAPKKQWPVAQSKPMAAAITAFEQAAK